jgi:nitrate/nitrite transport system substrate-binding protein
VTGSSGNNNTPRAARNLAAAELHLGFVPLIDATPLIVAAECGFFAAEGLRVKLDRQIGWGNVRDKLSYGQLQASHCLAGMPAASALGMGYFPEPLIAVFDLGSGANAITLSKRLTDDGVATAGQLAIWARRHRVDHPPVLAHVFGCSTHHYLLREWLASAGIDPDRDVRLCVLPPPQMVGQLGHGVIDGFCVGEPWNTLAADRKVGSIGAWVGGGLSSRPNKVIAMNRRWLDRHGDEATAIIRACIRACEFCQDPAHLDKMVAILSRPAYLNLPGPIVRQSLRMMNFKGLESGRTCPTAGTSLWIIREMIRWKHAPADVDATVVARRCMDSRPYRAAAAALGIECPPEESGDGHDGTAVTPAAGRRATSSVV